MTYYVAKSGVGRGESLPVLRNIGDGSLSKFAPDGVILKHRPIGTVLASLGNRTWGALGLPLQMITCTDSDGEGDDEVIYCYMFQHSDQQQFFFIWQFAPIRAAAKPLCPGAGLY